MISRPRPRAAGKAIDQRRGQSDELRDVSLVKEYLTDTIGKRRVVGGVGKGGGGSERERERERERGGFGNWKLKISECIVRINVLLVAQL